MKKLILIFSVLISLSSGLFAFDFFEDRIVEVKFGSSFGLSNNASALGDWLKKDLVIDLREIANKVPDSGLNLTSILDPNFATKIQIGGFSIAAHSGLDLYMSLTMDDDLFDLLGYGNILGIPVVLGIYTDIEAFAFVDVDIGLKFKKFSLNIIPAVFVPVLATAGPAGSVQLLNDAEGNVMFRYDVNFDLYSVINFTDMNIVPEELIKAFGYDLTGELVIPFENKITAGSRFRIPVIPGRISNLFSASSSFVFEGTLSNQKFTQSDTGFQYGFGKTGDYVVHRPLKLNVFMNYQPLNHFIDIDLAAGFGIKHPFSQYFKFYPEYYLGLTLSLLRVFSFTLSTEYTNQVFIHQFGLDVNIRFVEIDTGISVQSADFARSFTGSGFGAYVYLTMGF